MKTILALIAVMFMASLGHGQTNQLEEVGPGALEQVWAIAVQHQDVDKIDRIQAAEYVFNRSRRTGLDENQGARRDQGR